MSSKYKKPVQSAQKVESKTVATSEGWNPVEKAPSSAVTVRMPVSLAELAKDYALASGVSLNSLVCIALVDYLRDRGRNPA